MSPHLVLNFFSDDKTLSVQPVQVKWTANTASRQQRGGGIVTSLSLPLNEAVPLIRVNIT
jgi:hypothetical protein